MTNKIQHELTRLEEVFQSTPAAFLKPEAEICCQIINHELPFPIQILNPSKVSKIKYI